MDWTATFLEAAGVAAHPDYPLDGASLLPTLAKPSAAVERDLFWRMKYRNQKAMRSGEWKYLSIEGDEFLFNLARDERERANHAKREPDRIAAMRRRYAEWEKTLPEFSDATFSVPATKADLAIPSG
jgi:arylsulfatase A-like enzyme